jgi:hypothetical protein
MEQANLPPTKVDLSLISLDDIVQEIFRRHDSVIIGALKYKDVAHYNVLRKYYGHRHSCLALASNLASLINNDENKSLGPMVE